MFTFADVLNSNGYAVAKSPKLSVAQVIHAMGNEPQVRSLARFMWEYLQEELTRGHIIDQHTVQDAIESWASQHASE